MKRFVKSFGKRNRMINVLSLFDGISVAKEALTQLHIPNTYYASEIDKYAIKISETQHSDIIHIGDVCNISAADFDGICDFDLLIGGSPCQGFSLQGIQKGLEDDRSKLVTEYIRLKNELSPKYFLLENVKMKKECQDFISESLGVQPISINSLDFVPQSRERLYWTNIPFTKGSVQWNLDWLTEGFPGKTKKGPPREVVITDYFGCLTATYYKGVRADGRPLITKTEGLFDEIRDSVRMLTPEECELIQGLKLGYTAGVSNTQRYKALGNAFTLPVICHILQQLKNIS
jgi:DNA (cytosine-5)-methyltransferase 3A